MEKLSTNLFKVNFIHPLLMRKEGELAGVQNVFSKSVRGGLTRNLKIMMVGNLGMD